MAIVDFHNHFYPPEYLRAVQAGPSHITVAVDSAQNPVLHYPGDYHLGGAIPYLAERLDRGFYAFRECRQHISRPPSTYLEDFYYDTVNFDAKALQLAIDFAGTDHLLAGSDYPHQIGSLERMLASVGELNLPAAARAGILGGNAERLLNPP